MDTSGCDADASTSTPRYDTAGIVGEAIVDGQIAHPRKCPGCLMMWHIATKHIARHNMVLFVNSQCLTCPVMYSSLKSFCPAVD